MSINHLPPRALHVGNTTTPLEGFGSAAELQQQIATLRAQLAASEARAERLARLLLEADEVALKIVSAYGVVDAIDNDGDAYQSQALADELQAIRAALAKGEAG